LATQERSGGQRFAIARYNPNGTLDKTFGAEGKVRTNFPRSSNDWAYDVAIQPDGKLLVAGQSGFLPPSAESDFFLARYNANGTLDSSFSHDGKKRTDFGGNADGAYGVAVQADGKIVVAGGSSRISVDEDGSSFIVETDFALARYNEGGTRDTSFDGDGKSHHRLRER
jgi:uncharacterized delta-60 repeat protein